MPDSPSASSVEPPFRRIGPHAPASPLIISVPHAGRNYSPALLEACRLPLEKLEALEDRLVDRLVWRAVAAGATAIVADAPRAEIDLNRDEREVDAAMVTPSPSTRALLQSARTRGGLGLVPSRIAGEGPIWRQRLAAGELSRRIEQVHRPYHAAVAEALESARARFGVAVLLDCHSMPPRADGESEPGIVLGDRHGTSSAACYVESAVLIARRAGFRVARNAPYAGGYVTYRHGSPCHGVHALQLEIDRSLYLDSELRSPGPGFERVACLVAAIAHALTETALESAQPIAAE